MELFDANEETGRRICILFEFLQGKPVYESYLNLCNKIGKDAIQFKDFDFWYHRFASGKLDLGYDVSSEPEKKGFNDLPLETVDKIFDWIDHPIEKMKLRKVCKNFKDIIDNQNSREKTLAIEYLGEYVRINLTGEEIHYHPTKKGCSVDVDFGERSSEMFFKERNYVKMAFGHIEYLLKLPNLKLDKLRMNLYDITDWDEKTVYLRGMDSDDSYEESDDSDEDSSKVIKAHNRINSMRIIPFLIAVLEAMTHQLHTKSIAFEDIKVGDFARILKCCKPGFMESIEFHDENDETDEEQAKLIYESEQWKLAVDRHITVDYNCTLIFLLHSDTIKFRLSKLIPDEIVRIRETLYTHPNLKNCCIYCFAYGFSGEEFSFEDIYSALGLYTEIPNSPQKRSYKIPDSEGTLEFAFENRRYSGLTIDVRKTQ
ncbi:unnamed protein product [Caenorhabditis brenneri]